MIKPNQPEPNQGIPDRFTYLRTLITDAYLAVEERRNEQAIVILGHARHAIAAMIEAISAEEKSSQ